VSIGVPDVALATGLALAAAVAFGLGSAAQQRAAAKAPGGNRLVREPRWLGGVLGVGAGLALQVGALAFGPVALVQPLGVAGVLVAALAAGQGQARAAAPGVLACAAGLAAFLLLARPAAAPPGVPPVGGSAVALGAALLVAVAAAAVVAARRDGAARAVALTVAAGACYGVSAGMLRVVASQVRVGGAGAALENGALYAAALIGPVGFVLSQLAFRAARSAAPVLAVLTTVDPLVAVAVGVCWLGERIALAPAALAGELLAAAVVVAGIAVVVRAGERAGVPG
jgi:drug/metabolite transporter (DMT)-like permease